MKTQDNTKKIKHIKNFLVFELLLIAAISPIIALWLTDILQFDNDYFIILILLTTFDLIVVVLFVVLLIYLCYLKKK